MSQALTSTYTSLYNLLDPGGAGAEVRIQTDGSLERITDPTRIDEVLGSLVRHQAPGILRQGNLAAPVRPVACNRELDVTRWELGDAIASTPCVIELVGYNSVFRVTIERAFQQGRHLVTPIPKAIERVRRRWLRRQAVTSQLQATLIDRASGREIVCPVRDVSYAGLSVWLEGDRAEVESIAQLELVVADRSGRRVALRGEVRFTAPAIRGGIACGLRIQPVANDMGWIDLVNDQLHPDTRVGSRWSEHAWELYEQCGYFALSGKTPADFVQLRRAFLSTSKQLDRAPHIGCHVVWPRSEPEGATAALSVLKVYKGTWLGYQMAKQTGDSPEGVSGRDILRAIHQRAYEHVQRDPELRWIVGYAQVKRVWSRLVHYELPRRYVDSGEACIVRFRALEVPCAEGGKALEDGVASPSECDALAETIARLRPRAYADALDLVPSRMDLRENARLWRGSRFERERVILVVRREGLAMAAAVLEMGAEGMHLFGLLDLVRLYPLAQGGEDYFPELLEAAKAWFHEQGRQKFVCFLEEGTELPADTMAGMVDMGLADMTILAAHRVPELLEHLFEVTAPK